MPLKKKKRFYSKWKDSILAVTWWHCIRCLLYWLWWQFLCSCTGRWYW